jgi:hypothetical protein
MNMIRHQAIGINRHAESLALSGPGCESALTFIPFRIQRIEKTSIAAVTNRNVDNLRWSAEQQCSIVKVDILTDDDEILRPSQVPDPVGVAGT